MITKRSNKGITLIALVVTITVMLILTGVAVKTLTGDNDMITIAKDARQQTKKEEIINEIQRKIASEQLKENEENISKENLKKILEEYGNIIYDSDGNISALDVEEISEKIAIDELYSESTDELTSSVTIPDGYCYVGGTKNTGLVISDSASDENKYKGKSKVGIDLVGNQYVWIEVPKTTTVYKKAGLNITTFSTGARDYIKADLISYVADYRENGYSDVWYDGCGLSKTDYETMYNKMLESVYKNEGFWIGRYEAGIESNRTSHSAIATDLVPTSKANQYPLTYVCCSEAQTLASRVLPSGETYTSSLMFGLQWDLVLKFLESKGVSQEALKGTTTGSTNWGNYYDASFNVKNTSAKYSTDYGTSWSTPTTSGYSKFENSLVLLTTGADGRNSKMNIYDLAGNVSEWTLEYTSNSSYPSAKRGGYFYCYGFQYPASYHYYGDVNDVDHGTVGARVSLY